MLSAQERKRLSETRDILEELLETEEVLSDKALTKTIRNSQQNVKKKEKSGISETYRTVNTS
jgi:hypothetical protein